MSLIFVLCKELESYMCASTSCSWHAMPDTQVTVLGLSGCSAVDALVELIHCWALVTDSTDISSDSPDLNPTEACCHDINKAVRHREVLLIYYLYTG